jgi:hypothetical protein
VTLFFQALDAQGLAVQTMRSATHVQPGQTLSCIGCHDDRTQAPPPKPTLASLRDPSKIAVGPEGSWPFRFDRLIQPVLDAQCVSCHNPKATDTLAAKFDLTPEKAYSSLVDFGKPSLRDQVLTGYRRGYSIDGEGLAQTSALLKLLDQPKGHFGAPLNSGARDRLLTWIDTYAQRLGAFSPEQEKELEALRAASSSWLRDSQHPHREASQGSDPVRVAGF